MPGPSTIWLGDSEARPPHWGGSAREASVRGRIRLASGAAGVLVRIEPPLPPQVDRPPLADAILMARYKEDSLDTLADSPMFVNVLGPRPGVDITKALFADGELEVRFWADAATSPEALPQPIDDVEFWRQTLARVRRYIERHGDSRVPDGYRDEDGPLDVIAGSLRWHHAGKGGASPGPFPGADYAADLDDLEGWEW